MAKEKKKPWIKILAPREFGEKVLGETLLTDKLIGRPLKLSLSSITGDFKKQNNILKFVIKEVKDQAITELVGYNLSDAYLRRLVRKGKEKIDDSFICESKDKIRFKLKPFMLTRQKTSNSIITALIKKSREILTKYAKENSFVNIIRDITSNRLQMNLKKSLKDVYPLSMCEIKAVERVK